MNEEEKAALQHSSLSGPQDRITEAEKAEMRRRLAELAGQPVTVPVALQEQPIRIATPDGEVRFTIKMTAEIRDGEVYVTADVPEDTIEYLLHEEKP